MQCLQQKIDHKVFLLSYYLRSPSFFVMILICPENTKAISEKIKRDHVDEYYKRQAKVEPGTSIKLLLNRTRFRAKVSECVYISLKVCENLHTYCVFQRYHYYFIQRNV